MRFPEYQGLIACFGLVGGFILLCVWASITDSSCRNLHKLRLACVAPLTIQAGFSLHTYLAFRRRHGFGSEPGAFGKMRDGLGIHAVVGLIMVGWTLLSTYIFNRTRTKSLPATMDWKMTPMTTAYFYIMSCDFALVVGMVAGLASLSPHTPWNPGKCASSKKLLLSAAECRDSNAIQVMALVLVFIFGLQWPLMWPLTAQPRLIRIPYIIHAYRREAKRADLAKPLYVDRGSISKPPRRFLRLLDSEQISLCIAQNLHYHEVVNLSLACKAVRHAVFGAIPSKKADNLCESACMEGEKAECWACARVVCKGCAVQAHQLKRPRTYPHQTSCRPVCTRCFLLRATCQPSPQSPSHRSIDARHPKSCEQSHPWTVAEPQPLCRLCYGDQERAVKVREDRDLKMLKAGAEKGAECAECDVRIDGRRWWICGSDRLSCHECHWKGHDILYGID